MLRNSELAIKLREERRKVCGVIGEAGRRTCPVAPACCEYAVEDSGSGFICTLKIAADVMAPLPLSYTAQAPQAKQNELLRNAMQCLQPAEVGK